MVTMAAKFRSDQIFFGTINPMSACRESWSERKVLEQTAVIMTTPLDSTAGATDLVPAKSKRRTTFSCQIIFNQHKHEDLIDVDKR